MPSDLLLSPRIGGSRNAMIAPEVIKTPAVSIMSQKYMTPK